MTEEKSELQKQIEKAKIDRDLEIDKLKREIIQEVLKEIGNVRQPKAVSK